MISEEKVCEWSVIHLIFFLYGELSLDVCISCTRKSDFLVIFCIFFMVQIGWQYWWNKLYPPFWQCRDFISTFGKSCKEFSGFLLETGFLFGRQY